LLDGDQAVQVLAVQELHGQDRGAVFIAIEAPDLNDVGVVELGDDLRLVDEAQVGAIVHGRELVHELYGADAVALLVDGTVDRAHRSAPEHVFDAVAAGEYPTDCAALFGRPHQNPLGRSQDHYTAARGAHRHLLDLTEETQQSIEHGERVRRTAG